MPAAPPVVSPRAPSSVGMLRHLAPLLLLSTAVRHRSAAALSIPTAAVGDRFPFPPPRSRGPCASSSPGNDVLAPPRRGGGGGGGHPQAARRMPSSRLVVVRRYAEDPVVDVGVGVEPSLPPPRPSSPWLCRLLPPLSSAIRHLGDVARGRAAPARALRRLLLGLGPPLRRLLEGRTIYVLECAHGKYYVGSTTDRRRRYREHASRRGSRWTRVHPPVAVRREYRRVPRAYLPGMESRVTAEMMLAHGVNNVRGSMFCGTRDYHAGDLDALTKFLGHYNDLDYGEVYAGLRATLPPAGEGGASPVPSSASRRRRRYRGSGGGGRGGAGCYACGGLGHLAASCPEGRGIAHGPGPAV